jgi:hypothetical protein
LKTLSGPRRNDRLHACLTSACGLVTFFQCCVGPVHPLQPDSLLVCKIRSFEYAGDVRGCDLTCLVQPRACVYGALPRLDHQELARHLAARATLEAAAARGPRAAGATRWRQAQSARHALLRETAQEAQQSRQGKVAATHAWNWRQIMMRTMPPVQIQVHESLTPLMHSSQA